MQIIQGKKKNSRQSQINLSLFGRKLTSHVKLNSPHALLATDFAFAALLLTVSLPHLMRRQYSTLTHRAPHNCHSHISYLGNREYFTNCEVLFGEIVHFERIQLKHIDTSK